MALFWSDHVGPFSKNVKLFAIFMKLMFYRVYLCSDLIIKVFKMSLQEKYTHVDFDVLRTLAGAEELKDFYIINDKFFQHYQMAESVIFDGFIIAIYPEGGGTISINGRDFQIKERSVLLIPPNTIIRYGKDTPGRSSQRIMVSLEMMLHIPSPLDTAIIANARRTPFLYLDEEQFKDIEDWFRMIEGEYAERDNIYRREILKAILYALILDIGNIYAHRGSAMAQAEVLAAERISDDFFRLMSQHYKQERTVKFYAAQMAITPKHLSKVIRNATGRSPHEWFDDAIMLEIKNQLRLTDKSILQISEELSFSTPSAFVQFFRHHEGITPHKYRRGNDI